MSKRFCITAIKLSKDRLSSVSLGFVKGIIVGKNVIIWKFVSQIFQKYFAEFM